jgi:hypothetical protein
MSILEEIQRSTIFWWYAIDDYGNVAMVNSSACKTPKDLPDSMDLIESFGDYVESMPTISLDLIPNPVIDQFVKFDRHNQRLNYFEELAWPARRGFFVYDKTEPCVYDDAKYHQVYAPSTALKIHELTSDIAVWIKKVKISGDFRAAISIDISNLW